MSQLLFVTFHYIRDPGQFGVGGVDETNFPGIHPMGTDEFAEQLAWLAARFHIATPQEAEAHVLGQRDVSEPSVLLTFDDGLVDHGPAAEVLEDAGFRGVFFVTSRPLTENLPLVVHKAHWLRATTAPDDFLNEFNNLLPTEWRDPEDPDPVISTAAKIYIYDSPADAMVKYRINFVLPHDVVDAVTTAMLDGRGLSGAEFCQRTYLDAGAIKALHSAGHSVAAHGHSHTPFSRLEPEDLAKDIGTNLECLEGVLGARPTWVSYPNGRSWAVPRDTAAFCRQFGFAIGLTLNPGWNKAGADPTSLHRINTNEVDKVAPLGIATDA